MITLALDTSSSCVAAAVLDGSGVLASEGIIADRGQGEQLAPLVARVLESAGVKSARRVVVGVGPGPFTGLRVGLVTAAVLARVWDAELVGVCSLDALARRTLADRPGAGVLVAGDARRGEVYWARYDEEGARVEGPAVDLPAIAAEQAAAHGLRASGEGALRHLSVFEAAGVAVEAGHPLDAAELALRLLDQPGSALPATPLYLRDPDAVPPGPRKQVSL